MTTDTMQDFSSALTSENLTANAHKLNLRGPTDIVNPFVVEIKDGPIECPYRVAGKKKPGTGMAGWIVFRIIRTTSTDPKLIEEALTHGKRPTIDMAVVDVFGYKADSDQQGPEPTNLLSFRASKKPVKDREGVWQRDDLVLTPRPYYNPTAEDKNADTGDVQQNYLVPEARPFWNMANNALDGMIEVADGEFVLAFNKAAYQPVLADARTTTSKDDLKGKILAKRQDRQSAEV